VATFGGLLSAIAGSLLRFQRTVAESYPRLYEEEDIC
jgi:hypothetical protein